jgi:hypothetical protein
MWPGKNTAAQNRLMVIAASSVVIRKSTGLASSFCLQTRITNKNVIDMSKKLTTDAAMARAEVDQLGLAT